MSDAQMCSREVRAVAAALPERIDQAALAALAGLPAPLSEVRDEQCDDETFRRLWRGIMLQGADPTLPFEIGLGISFGTYEVIDYLAGACPTVGAGLEKLSRYFALITANLTWECDAQAARVSLASRHLGLEEQLVFVQYTLAVTFGRFRDFAEGALEFVDVELAMPEPPSRARHEAFFGCPVRYDRDISRCVLTRKGWDAPLARHEPVLSQILERHAALLMARQKSGGDDMAAVRTAIHELLPDGPPKLESVAKAVATSTRTLQRRLRETGTTFQALVEEERCSAARAHLSNARLAVAEIAYLSGYSEASAFVRAFKRWTGKTPGQFRDQPS